MKVFEEIKNRSGLIGTAVWAKIKSSTPKDLASIKGAMKGLITLTGAYAVNAVVGTVIKSHLPVESRKLDKLLLGVGSWMISVTISDLVVEHLLEELDQEEPEEEPKEVK